MTTKRSTKIRTAVRTAVRKPVTAIDDIPAEVMLDLAIPMTSLNNEIHDWIAAHAGRFPDEGPLGALEREAIYRLLWTPYEVSTIAEACERVADVIAILRDPDSSVGWLFDHCLRRSDGKRGAA